MDHGEDSASLEIEKAVLPALANYLEKLDHELLKAFQNTPHTKVDYLLRLRDDNKFVFLCDSVMEFFQSLNDQGKAARIAILKLDHLYYKHDSLYEKIQATPNTDSDAENKSYILTDSARVFADLVRLINEYGIPKTRLRATLYHAYHLALHSKFTEARDLLLRTHVAESVQSQDINSQVLFNRTITQLGISAFRLGLIEESHDVLVEVCQTAKLREVLAQGISRAIDKPAEYEKEE